MSSQLLKSVWNAISQAFSRPNAALLYAMGIALATTLLMTWPLAADPGHQVLKAAFHWDAYTNAMIMGSRIDAALGRSALDIYDNYFFAPLPDTIVFNENHFGLSWLFAPFYLTTDQPLLAYNMTLLVSLAACVWFTQAFVKRLTGNGAAGLLAGVAFAFCPYAMYEMGRIQLVATQWIPACFLFLHRAFEERKRRDVAAFWFFYLMQIGTCLYYAMFLVPLLSFLAVMLAIRERPPLRVYAWLAAGAAVSGAIALCMVYPYFAARKAFDLERTLAFASSYDGQLSFFTNVAETNRTLTWMHEPLKFRGAFEDIAFPGFSVLLLAALAVTWSISRRVRSDGARAVGRSTLALLTTLAAALLVSALSRSMLFGLLVVVLVVGVLVWRKKAAAVRSTWAIYLALLLLAVVLFLGLFPFEYDGSPVRGLYYYLHTYFPGYNGIRKVSRQAVMVTFILCVLAGMGAATLLRFLPKQGHRTLALAVLGVVLCLELRSFPHPVHPVWAGENVPNVLRFAATLPADDLIASVPQNAGAARFRGDEGMALHNYLALYHKHEFVNGQSSWLPPATELVLRSLHQLPNDAARRALLSVGARHLIVFGDDLPPARRGLPDRLAGNTDHYSEVFREGEHRVLSLLHADSPEFELLETRELPANAELIPKTSVRGRASAHSAYAGLALDGKVGTRWSSNRPQRPHEYFEFVLDEPREVIALEVENPAHAFDTPASFQLSAAMGASGYHTLVDRPVVRLYREQVEAPKRFIFRIVLDEPQLIDRLRLTVKQPLPGYYFSIHEARLYSQAD